MTTKNPAFGKSRLIALAAGGFVLVCLLVIFWDGLNYMVQQWDREEYNHGYLIPLVAVYLLWLRADDLRAANVSGSWLGLIFIAISIAGLVLGEMSSIYAIVQYSFLMALFGLIITVIGWRGFRIVWVQCQCAVKFITKI